MKKSKKFLCFLITLNIFCSVLFSHPIKQVDFYLHVNDGGRLVIKAKLNLAYLLCIKKDFDLKEYETEYRKILALDDAAFKDLVDSKLDFIQSKFDIKANGQQLRLDINWVHPNRLMIPADLILIDDQILHDPRVLTDVQMSVELPIGVKQIHWKNKWYFVDHSLQISSKKSKSSSMIWVNIDSDKLIELDVENVPWYKYFFYFVWEGIVHIVPYGLDHILFIICVFLVFNDWKNLLLQVSCFTIAHTITFAFASSSLINISPNIVEPVIALSIVALGIENCISKKANKSRLLLVFLFGLIHGLGFASVFMGKGLELSEFILSLVGFNIGVELGQIFIILLAWLVLGVYFRQKSYYQSFIVRPISICIGFYALFLFFDRIL